MRSPLRRPVTLALALVAALALAACGADEAGSAPATEETAGTGAPEEDPAEAPDDGVEDGAERTVTTDQGEVTIPARPERVVVLNHGLAGYLYQLDVPVTATIPEHTEVEGRYSERWAEAAEADGTEFLPWSDDGFNLEALTATNPDLIVAGGYGFPAFQAIEAYDQLSEIAPTVVVSGDLETWEEQFSFLAEDVFDRPERYAELVAAHEDRVEEVAAAITPPPGPVTYLSIGADGRAFALIEDTGLPTELEEVGIEPAPVFADNDVEPYVAGGDMFEVSEEVVGDIVTTPTAFIMGFNAETFQVADLRERPVWASLPAFVDGHAYDLPYWVVRPDYDEAMALLDLVEEEFS